MYFMLAILSKNKTMLVLLTQTMHICSVNLTCERGLAKDGTRGDSALGKKKKYSAGTEVTGTQRDNYKQADSFEKSLEIPHHHRSGSSFRGIDGMDGIADRSVGL